MAESIPLRAVPTPCRDPGGDSATSPAGPVPARPLARLLPSGRLIEISGDASGARTTTAVSIVSHAQACGELAAWVQPRGGALYPPDLEASGIDLASLVCVHVPPARQGGRRRHAPALRAAELLLRSGAFGLVVVDLSDDVPNGRGATGGIMTEPRWQGRLAGVLREHGAKLVLLTHTCSDAPSLGPLVGVRVEARRERIGDAHFALRPAVLKAKVGLEATPSPEDRRSPCGLP